MLGKLKIFCWLTQCFLFWYFANIIYLLQDIVLVPDVESDEQDHQERMWNHFYSFLLKTLLTDSQSFHWMFSITLETSIGIAWMFSVKTSLTEIWLKSVDIHQGHEYNLHV